MSKLSNQPSGRQWTRANNETANVAGLQVSNENVCLPPETDLRFHPNFCDEAQRKELLQDIQKGMFIKGGFSRRIRVQTYSLVDDYDACPESLRRLAVKVQQRSLPGDTELPPPTHIFVEEHSLTPWSYSGDYAPNRVVATFETRAETAEESPAGPFYAARLVLQDSVVFHINRPAEKQELLWKLQTAESHTNILLEAGNLLVQQGESLDSWRSYTTAAPNNKGGVAMCNSDEDVPKSIIVKFARLPESDLIDQERKNEVEFGYVAKEEDRIPRSGEMPPVKELLTIIVTTSPIKSHPSTQLLERTFDTFALAGEDFLDCPKVIVCDGFRQQDLGKVSKRHNNPKQAMRNGIVNEEQANNYKIFKQRLRKLCEEASNESPFRNTRVEELDERMGYGFALRHSLRHCVSTHFVCVIQHDRTFMRQTPLYDVVHTMWRHRTIKYVGFSMRSNLMYRDIFEGKYGKASKEELGNMILRPPELLLDAATYGPNGNSDEALADLVGEKVLKSIRACAGAYRTSMQCTKQLKWVQDHPPPEGKHQLSLTPTLFWFDNTHICETAHYRDFVFHLKYKMVARGGFVEDKLSPVMKRTTERLGLTEGHARFGCYILDDHSGLFFTGHLDGGSYVTEETRAAMVETM